MNKTVPFTEVQQKTIATLAEAKAEQPVLDLDELSWGDSKKIALLSGKLNEASADAAAQIAVFEELEPLIAGLVISVPRSWLVRSAPDPWKVNLPGALNYLKRDRLMDLFNAALKGIGDKDAATGE